MALTKLNKQQMSEVAKEQHTASIYQSIKSFCSKITWKNSLIVVIPLSLYLMRWPIAKLFLTLVQLKNSQSMIYSQNCIKQIIITSNQSINLSNLQKLRGKDKAALRISEFNSQNCKILDYTQIRDKVWQSQSKGLVQHQQRLQSLRQKQDSQILWQSFNQLKQREAQMELLLIRAPEQKLKSFVLKFYQLGQQQAHKIGNFSANKIHILRLDERMGTYEHIVFQIQIQ